MGRIWPLQKSSSAEIMDPRDWFPSPAPEYRAENSNSKASAPKESSAVEARLCGEDSRMKCIGLAGALWKYPLVDPLRLGLDGALA